MANIHVYYCSRVAKCLTRNKHLMLSRHLLLKVTNGNTLTICEICSNLTIKSSTWSQWRLLCVFIVNFRQTSYIAQSQQWKHHINMRNLFKDNNSNINMKSLTSFWCLYCNFCNFEKTLQIVMVFPLLTLTIFWFDFHDDDGDDELFLRIAIPRMHMQ